MDVYIKKKDEVSDVDHVAFLLYWLSLHVACCRSKKVIKAYLALIMALHLEIEVAIGPFVLSHIFRGMDDLVLLKDDEHSRNARGPIRMLQLWLTAYFPELSNGGV